MLVNDARGNAVTASGPLPVTLLDNAVDAYLGFRKDTGDRLKAALTAEPDFVLAHCLRGYFMMLFGQRAMVSRAQRSLDAAQASARRNRCDAARGSACRSAGGMGRRRFRRRHRALGGDCR